MLYGGLRFLNVVNYIKNGWINGLVCNCFTLTYFRYFSNYKEIQVSNVRVTIQDPLFTPVYECLQVTCDSWHLLMQKEGHPWKWKFSKYFFFWCKDFLCLWCKLSSVVLCYNWNFSMGLFVGSQLVGMGEIGLVPNEKIHIYSLYERTQGQHYEC